MIPLLQQNLAPWMAQVVMLAAVGSLLPVLFRIHHPRTHLVYCHLLLAACLLLPILQPWRQAKAGTPVPTFLIWILAAGFLIRLAWLLTGLWRIRTYRIESTPLFP